MNDQSTTATSLEDKLVALRVFVDTFKVPDTMTFRQLAERYKQEVDALGLGNFDWKGKHSEEIEQLIFDINEGEDIRGWIRYEEGLDDFVRRSQ